MRFPRLKLAVLSACLMAVPLSLHAGLHRAGPVDPAHGFPLWYQDAGGLALEFCSPTTAADLNAGLCAVLPGAPPAGLDPARLPEAFPGNFSLEHFYYLLTTSLPTAGLDKKTRLPVPGAGRFVFVNGLEATFNVPVPQAGQQVTFSRWRVRQDNVACTGNYTFHTPSRAPKTVQASAGGRIAYTEDIGIGPGFEGALAGSVGPFLRRADTPGGAPAANFVGADGKQYLSAGDLGPVTGSRQQNTFQGSAFAHIPPQIRSMPMTDYVMVTGPGIASGNCAQEEAVYALNELQVLGRINTTPISSRSSIDRVSYRVIDSDANGVPDRFRIGAWARVLQEPGRPEPVLAISLNKGDPADEVNATPELAMLRRPVAAASAEAAGAAPAFQFFSGQLQPVVPGQTGPGYGYARIRTTTDTPPRVVNMPLVDELRITVANYNANTRTLTVSADSGAFLSSASPAGQTASGTACSNPCLRLDDFGLPASTAAGVPIDYKLKVPAGSRYAVASVTIPEVQSPPAYVTVRSSAGGMDTAQVMYVGASTGTAWLQDDATSTAMNVPVSIDVLANDIGVSAVPRLVVCPASTGAGCGVPAAAAVCVPGAPSASCTAQGGRLSLNGNMVVYTPRPDAGGYTDSFYYHAATAPAGTRRALVSVEVGSLNGMPDARDDLGHTGVVGLPVVLDVLANDFSPGGVRLETLRITSAPVNTDTGASVPGAAAARNGRIEFTPPAPGNWNLSYTFDNAAGMTADPGVVAVNAVAAEIITVQRARWTDGRPPASGTLAVNGLSNIAQGHVLQLRAPNASTGAAACNRPALGQLLGAAKVLAGGAFDFGAIPRTAKPAAVYVYSPAFGGCTQLAVP